LPAFVDNFFRSRQSGFSNIPSQAAWQSTTRPTSDNCARQKTEIKQMIDDGYFGRFAPVGGLEQEPFRAVYRGDFVRWHLEGWNFINIKACLSQINSVFFVKPEGAAQGVAEVLCAGKATG